MTPIEIWQSRWSISPEAIQELITLFDPPPTDNPDRVNEQSVQTDVRLAGSKAGWRLWRNNVGATRPILVTREMVGTTVGNFVRYGLCNTTPAENARIKSSDLVGIKPVVITLEMVGSTIGQFVAREVKKSNWTYKGTKREVAQSNYLALVNSLGGDGKFTTGGLY